MRNFQEINSNTVEVERNWKPRCKWQVVAVICLLCDCKMWTKDLRDSSVCILAFMRVLHSYAISDPVSTKMSALDFSRTARHI